MFINKFFLLNNMTKSKLIYFIKVYIIVISILYKKLILYINNFINYSFKIKVVEINNCKNL